MSGSSEAQLAIVADLIRQGSRIIVVAGAGISTSAGIPDYRSPSGIFRTASEEYGLKGPGKQLFHADVWRSKESRAIFYRMIARLYGLSKDAQPSPFHQLLSGLASRNCLARLYSQNIDGLDTRLKNLSTVVPFGVDDGDQWPKTVQLHGSINHVSCNNCNYTGDNTSTYFAVHDVANEPPPCPKCTSRASARASLGKRLITVGHLRPRILLYGENNDDGIEHQCVIDFDTHNDCDILLVAGTSLKLDAVRKIVGQFAKQVHSHPRGITIWLNANDEPPSLPEKDRSWDHVLLRPCDDLAAQLTDLLETPSVMAMTDNITESTSTDNETGPSSADSDGLSSRASTPCPTTRLRQFSPAHTHIYTSVEQYDDCVVVADAAFERNPAVVTLVKQSEAFPKSTREIESRDALQRWKATNPKIKPWPSDEEWAYST